jgi:bifunctional DNA-binding transcriptional regulator/antitoxin component of YhaV-PrlF toxin-antitoxin module
MKVCNLGEVTTLTKAATKTTSLRTTVPASIVRQFKLEDGDKIDWTLDIKDGKMIVLVQPIKKTENKAVRHR